MSKVIVNRSISVAGGKAYAVGDEADVDPILARAWLDGGVAEPVDGEVYDTDTEDDGLDDLKKKELVALADERGLDTGGTKAVLIDRLRAADDDPADVEDVDGSVAEPVDGEETDTTTGDGDGQD